jgi:hypothetical protein
MTIKTIEIDACPWCMKTHRKKPSVCLSAIARLARRYQANYRPAWVSHMLEETTAYINNFKEGETK